MDIITVGRDSGSSVRPPSHLVSRHHAELILEDGAWVLRDLGSTNGTFINGRKIRRQRLNPGDIASFGGARYEFTGSQLVPHDNADSSRRKYMSRSNRRGFGVIVVALVSALAFGGLATAWWLDMRGPEQLPHDFSRTPDNLDQLIKIVSASSVTVRCGFNGGSGFAVDWIVSPDSVTHIVTNHHVVSACVDNADAVEISTDQFTARGSVIAYSTSGNGSMSTFEQDLAVVAIERFVPPLARALAIDQGHWVMAIGNPQGITGAATTGTIVQVLDSSPSMFLPKPKDWVVTDAVIIWGNSGGALVNNRGELVAVNTLRFWEELPDLGFSNGWPNLCAEVVRCQSPSSW